MTNALALLDPPLDPETDCRGLDYMPLRIADLLDSDLYALATGDEFKAALTLWCKAWTQVPAASLPNDDRILAKWSGVSLREWGELREMALKGFTLCSDGRLYHLTIAQLAVNAYSKRRGNAARAKARWDKEKGVETPGATAMPRHAPSGEAAMEEEGKGKGKGKGKEEGTPDRSATDSLVTASAKAARPKAAKAKALPAEPKAARASRVPFGWTAGDEGESYARAQGFSPAEIREMEDAFFDWWKAAPGQKGVKLDWPATWRTWVRTEAKRRNRHGRGPSFDGPGGGAGPDGGNRAARIDAMQAGAVAALNRRR